VPNAGLVVGNISLDEVSGIVDSALAKVGSGLNVRAE
jgi:hypothetical protein